MYARAARARSLRSGAAGRPRGPAGARRRACGRAGAGRLRGLRLRDDGNEHDRRRDCLPGADPARPRRSRDGQVRAARSALAADPGRGDGRARDRRRGRRGCAAVRRDRRRAAAAARRRRVRRAQRQLRPGDAPARVRARGDRLLPRRSGVHARRVPAARAARRTTIACSRSATAAASASRTRTTP